MSPYRRLRAAGDLGIPTQAAWKRLRRCLNRLVRKPGRLRDCDVALGPLSLDPEGSFRQATRDERSKIVDSVVERVKVNGLEIWAEASFFESPILPGFKCRIVPPMELMTMDAVPRRVALIHRLPRPAEPEASCRGAAPLTLEALRLIPRLEDLSSLTGPMLQPDARRAAAYRSALLVAPR